MPRITPLTPEESAPKAQALLQGVQKALGMTPNLMTTLAHSPAALEAYLGFGQALAGGSLSARLREQIAVAVAGANGCGYCASAHTALGQKLGVDPAELEANLDGRSGDVRTAAALDFATAITRKRGWLSDGDLAAAREAGFTDGEITELVAVVAINTFTNYFNHIAQTEIDFPLVAVATTVASQ